MTYNIPPRTIITYKKNGNIKKLKSKYDDDSIINSPIEEDNTLRNLFVDFGKIYIKTI
jgi:hypothetical protein